MTKCDLSQEGSMYISEEEINLQTNYRVQCAVLLTVLHSLFKIGLCTQLELSSMHHSANP